VLDLGADQLRMVREILAAHLPAGRAFAFGSRVRGTARRFSDLDLLVQAERPLELELLGALRAAFSQSALPIKVDVVDWSTLGEPLRDLIAGELVSLYP
jgi:predicted nucleotidyltransferase